MTQFLTRISDYDIEPLLLRRWSRRAFTGEAMPQAELMRVLEAARWAPSSSNAQPWRFVYAHRDTPAWATLLDLLTETNRLWARNAALLLVALSKKPWTRKAPGQTTRIVSIPARHGRTWRCRPPPWGGTRMG